MNFFWCFAISCFILGIIGFGGGGGGGFGVGDAPGTPSWLKVVGSAIAGSISGPIIGSAGPIIAGSSIPISSPISSSYVISSSMPSSSPGDAFTASSSSGAFLLTSRLSEKGVLLLRQLCVQHSLHERVEHTLLDHDLCFP